MKVVFATKNKEINKFYRRRIDFVADFSLPNLIISWGVSAEKCSRQTNQYSFFSNSLTSDISENSTTFRNHGEKETNSCNVFVATDPICATTLILWYWEKKTNSVTVEQTSKINRRFQIINEMNDDLSKHGLFFDYLYNLRVLDPSIAGETTDLKEKKRVEITHRVCAAN